MQKYYGTKEILAVPMSRKRFTEYMTGDTPAEDTLDEPGFLVEYTDGDQPNHQSHAGYVSWSPRRSFIQAYQPVNALSFGHAIVALKTGHRISRAGWNGKGMFLYYVPANEYPAQRNLNKSMIGVFNNDMVPYRDYIAMKTAQNDVVPWVASQTDILANDWCIVD